MVARDIAGISQEELAARLGTSPAAFSKRLKTGKFSDQDFESIAQALGCKYKSGFYFDNGQYIE